MFEFERPVPCRRVCNVDRPFVLIVDKIGAVPIIETLVSVRGIRSESKTANGRIALILIRSVTMVIDGWIHFPILTRILKERVRIGG